MAPLRCTKVGRMHHVGEPASPATSVAFGCSGFQDVDNLYDVVGGFGQTPAAVHGHLAQ